MLMRVYVITTGVVFGLLALAHVLRIVVEGTELATNPWYILVTVAAFGLAAWAWRLLRSPARPRDRHQLSAEEDNW
jgi:hypothetical protein